MTKQAQWTHLNASGWPKLKKRLAAEDHVTDMEAVKYCLWLNPDRCSAFFANHVLLVEGPSEQSLINRLISDERIAPPEGGVYVLDCIGKFNIHRFMNIFSQLGILHSVIHDDDNGAEYHPDIAQLIHDSMDPNYTKEIVTVAGDIESTLGIPKTHAHRKPQHIMFFYESGQIDGAKLASFCKLVSTAFAPVG